MLVVFSLEDQLVLHHFCSFSLISMISLVDMMQNDSMSLSVTVSLAYGFVSWSSPTSVLTLSMLHATIVSLSCLVKKVPSLELLHATEFSVRLV